MRKLFLEINNKTLTLFLNDTETASIIFNAVPIISSINTWGEEIYFNTGLSIQKENDLKLDRIDGMSFNILKDKWSLSNDKSVNYITKFIKN